MWIQGDSRIGRYFGFYFPPNFAQIAVRNMGSYLYRNPNKVVRSLGNHSTLTLSSLFIRCHSCNHNWLYTATPSQVRHLANEYLFF